MIFRRPTLLLSTLCAALTAQPLAFGHPEKRFYMQSGAPGVLCDGNIVPEETEESIAYQNEMGNAFQRNLGNLSINKPVTIEFFLSADGFIRNLHVIEPGMNNIETLECVDAVLCSSPLPPPPSYRRPLPPAPFSEILPINWYGSSVYQYIFKTNDRGATSHVFKLRKIPLEVAYRYPKLFQTAELEAPGNFLLLKEPTSRLLEDLRFQWAIFFSKHSNPNKITIENWSQRVLTRFLPGNKTSG